MKLFTKRSFFIFLILTQIISSFAYSAEISDGKYLIIINGVPSAGKSVTADLLKTELETTVKGSKVARGSIDYFYQKELYSTTLSSFADTLAWSNGNTWVDLGDIREANLKNIYPYIKNFFSNILPLSPKEALKESARYNMSYTNWETEFYDYVKDELLPEAKFIIMDHDFSLATQKNFNNFVNYISWSWSNGGLDCDSLKLIVITLTAEYSNYCERLKLRNSSTNLIDHRKPLIENYFKSRVIKNENNQKEICSAALEKSFLFKYSHQTIDTTIMQTKEVVQTILKKING